MSNNQNGKNIIGGANAFGMRPRAGFTLVEVLTALFIVMVGILSGYTLVNQSISSSNSISMRMTAAYLGKEGIEIVKSIRDGNYMKMHYGAGTYDWTDGLAGNVDCSTAGCIAQYDSLELLDASDTAIDKPLKYSATDGFQYSAGDNTAYKRTILIVFYPNGDPNLEFLDVRVSISWLDHGKSRSITIRENLYNSWE